MSVLLLFSYLVAVALSDCPANTCSGSETCCTITAAGVTPEQYGCCPYEKASCCADFSHCCPNGWNCDVTKGQCIQANKRVTFALTSLHATLQSSCPAGTCPSTETCCSLTGGQWGCCPYASADCCTDHAHCCPQGYTCDVSKGQCTKSSLTKSTIAGSFIIPLVKVTIPQADCPAGTCPTSETCCSLTGGQWGCCPYANADCCTDHAHCCPQGYTCNVAMGQCSKGSAQSDSFSIVHLAKVVAPQADCPAGTCPTSETCCSLTGGQWGCCPYANADCCTDHAHCCPQGYACDVSKGQCSKSSKSTIAGTFHLPLIPVAAPQADCPAGTCSSTETCCSLTGGQWGCCPYANADCCTDHAHCCPQGYTCNVVMGQCTKGGAAKSTIAAFLPLIKVVAPQADCPAGTCPSTETCCSLTGGQWGCCPYANADCCTDHAHCCPQGYTCDVSKGQCTMGGALTGVKLARVVAPQADCPAGTCPSTETCCSLTGGQWGCCPYASADCCTDHAHCCPQGYTCDVSKGQCTKTGSSSSVLPLTKF